MGNLRNLIFVISHIFVVAIFLSSCDKNVAWTDTVSIPERGWTSDHPVVFNLDPKAYEPEENKYVLMTARAVGDTVPRLRGNYHAILSLRYKDDCNARSVRLALEKVSLDTDIRRDTITFTLFHDGGGSAGHGRFGLNETTLNLPYPFTADNGTTLTVTPLTYSAPIIGMLSITLTLSHH